MYQIQRQFGRILICPGHGADRHRPPGLGFFHSSDQRHPEANDPVYLVPVQPQYAVPHFWLHSHARTLLALVRLSLGFIFCCTCVTAPRLRLVCATAGRTASLRWICWTCCWRNPSMSIWVGFCSVIFCIFRSSCTPNCPSTLSNKSLSKHPPVCKGLTSVRLCHFLKIQT